MRLADPVLASENEGLHGCAASQASIVISVALSVILTVILNLII